MQRVRSENSDRARKLADRRMVVPVSIMLLQLLAAIFFVADGIEDQFALASQGFSLDLLMECLIAVALLAGVIVSLRYILRVNREMLRQEQALASARGALAEHIAHQFQKWGLTPGEAEVALFALKGCDVAEIALLRGAAAGTIRSQLSQIYGKAGVSSQAMLVSLFIEDLLDVAPSGDETTR